MDYAKLDEEIWRAIEEYGREEAVYVLADRWQKSTYQTESIMRSVRRYGDELFDSDGE